MFIDNKTDDIRPPLGTMFIDQRTPNDMYTHRGAMFIAKADAVNQALL